MKNKKIGYPQGLNDIDLKDQLNQYCQKLNGNIHDPNTVKMFSPLIELGIIEFQGRQTKRVTKISIILSLLSVLAAAAAIYISINTIRSSSRWEINQIKLLNNINLTLEKQLQKSKKPSRIKQGNLKK